MNPLENFSFFFCSKIVLTNFLLGWVFLISQYGASVSIIILFRGIFLTISKLISSLREHPFIPMYRSNARIYSISSTVPVNEWKTPVENRFLLALTMSKKSDPVFLLWRYIGRPCFSARAKCGSKCFSWVSLLAYSNLVFKRWKLVKKIVQNKINFPKLNILYLS